MPLKLEFGDQGPRISGLSVNAVVRDAIVNNNWWIQHFRSRNPIIRLLKNSLPEPNGIITSEEDDRFLWQVDNTPPVSSFSSSRTWSHLYDRLPEVQWHRSVWTAT
ncbi:hypothetical protein HA466_0267610 [Hirschfeldia incana]|nr:hypothetical protein HA466_0267610 [Hirschfeldia incana]